VPNIYMTINHYNKSQGIVPWRYIGSDQYDRDDYFGSSSALVEDINKLGCDNFEKIIIENFKDISNKELRYIEAKHLKENNVKHDPTFYNLTDIYAPAGGKKGMKHSRKFERSQTWKDSRKNFRYSDESRKKMSLAKLGRKLPDETRSKMSNSRRGHLNHNALEWIVQFPSGQVIKVKSLRSFCLEYGLSYGQLYNSKGGFVTRKIGKGKGGPQCKPTE
jgi:hypothetical protein